MNIEKICKFEKSISKFLGMKVRISPHTACWAVCLWKIQLENTTVWWFLDQKSSGKIRPRGQRLEVNMNIWESDVSAKWYEMICQTKPCIS